MGITEENQRLSSDERELRQRFCEAEQGHVFRFWDDLTADERETLLAQLRTVDLQRLDRLVHAHLAEPLTSLLPEIKPAVVVSLAASAADAARDRECSLLGEKELRAGRIAVLVVAGGQASRLGYEAPKGSFPITPITRKSLFQVHAEKIVAMQRRYNCRIPFVVLVSPQNYRSTKEFFEQEGFFGLDQGLVHFCEQGMLPAVDRDGRLLLAERGKIFLSPDGHGGVFRALEEGGLVSALAAAGVDQVFYFQVDNPLVRVSDPVFLGHHVRANADMSIKVVRKRDASEMVGVLAMLDGKPGIVEYSDLPEQLRSASDGEGNLLYWAGSIAIHVFRLDFIRSISRGKIDLPYHVARKRVPFLNERGDYVQPSEANGFKFEAFVFDALAFARRVVAIEVKREEEFAPVKNKSGEDSPQTSIELQSRMFRSWLDDAGVSDLGDGVQVEVGPLFALDREELKVKLEASRWCGVRRILLE